MACSLPAIPPPKIGLKYLGLGPIHGGLFSRTDILEKIPDGASDQGGLMRPVSGFAFSVCGWVRFEGAGLGGQGRRLAGAPRELCWGWGAGRWQAGQKRARAWAGQHDKGIPSPLPTYHIEQAGAAGQA